MNALHERYPWVIWLAVGLWAYRMAYPSVFVETRYMSQSENLIMTLMALVLLAALYLAMSVGEAGQSVFFVTMLLLYCGAY